jgi:hypothetical protein
MVRRAAFVDAEARQRLGQGADDADLGRGVVRQPRHLAQLDDGCVVAPGGGDQLHRVEAAEHDQVGAGDAVRLGGGTGKEADIPGVVVGHRALGLVGGEHGAGEAIGEGGDGGVQAAGLQADDEHRPPRRREPVVGGVQGGLGEALPGGGLHRARRRRQARLGRRQLQVHGPLGVAKGEVEERRQLGPVGVGPEPRAGLGDRREERDLVEGLVADGRARRQRVRHHHQGRPVEIGVTGAVDDAGGAGAEGGQRHPRRTRELAGHRRHNGGASFAGGEHEVDAVVRGRPNQIEARAPARDAEEAGDAARGEAGGQGLAERPHGRAVMPPSTTSSVPVM